jgi:hypothetical protein
MPRAAFKAYFNACAINIFVAGLRRRDKRLPSIAMEQLLPTRVRALSAEVDAQATVCPSCNFGFIFRRTAIPAIDACGFESYSLRCEACGTQLAGIIDPADEVLLLSATPA